MLNSLRARLLVILIVAVGVALAVMAIYTRQTTTDEFQRSVAGILRFRNLRLDRKIANIEEFISQHTGEDDVWPGLQSLMESMASSSQTRFVLTDLNGKVYADSSLQMIGKTINVSKSKPFAAYLIEGIPILAYYEPLDIPNPAQIQQQFIASVNRSLRIAILVSVTLAILLSIIFSKSILSPIQALNQAVQKIQHGDLSQRIQTKSKSELGVLAQSFNDMADNLQRVEQLRRNLVSDVAHELRTPLSHLRGYLEAMQDGILTPTTESITSLHSEVMLLSHLVDDLQDLALVEAGQLRINQHPTDLRMMVNQAVMNYQTEADKKGVILQQDIPAILSRVFADPERLEQIFGNLLDNALVYTPSGGTITIGARNESELILIRVSDTGIGIAPEHLPFIFERFYRADKSRSRSTGGVGLGLAIVRQLVEAQGGTVSVESALDQGTTVSFTLKKAGEQ
jgi:signal transduction histidine kinase